MRLLKMRAGAAQYRKGILPRVGNLLLLLGIMLSLRSPGLLVLVGVPQTVSTSHPIVCVHTRLTDEVEPWKIQRTLQMVREMGATSIVEYFPWAYLEPERGRFDWAHSDRVFEHAQAQGLRVIARVGLVPEWARPEVPDGDPVPVDTALESEKIPNFANFVKAFATRYRDKLEVIVIWNEPNLALEWGFNPVDPQAYTELVRQSYRAVKAVAPELLVLGGALAPTLEPPGSPHGMNTLEYLEQMYAAGFSHVSDGLAMHSYGLGAAPDADPDSNHLNFRYLELQRAIMETYGDSDKPVYVTESGWNDSPRWAFAVSPAERIQYTLDSFRWAEAHWPWVKNVCTWAFRYPSPTYGYFDNYTFVAADFEPKPIYYAVQEWTRFIEK